jgi:hypothetical protein
MSEVNTKPEILYRGQESILEALKASGKDIWSISRETDQISRQTLYSWVTASPARFRSPGADKLRILAHLLGVRFILE